LKGGLLRFALQAKRFGGQTVRHRRHATQIGVPVEIHGGHADGRPGIEEGVERSDAGDLDPLRQRGGHVVGCQHHVRADRLCKSRIGLLRGRVGEDDIEGDHLRASRPQALDQFGVKLPGPGPALADLPDGRLVDGHHHGARLGGKRRRDDREKIVEPRFDEAEGRKEQNRDQQGRQEPGHGEMAPERLPCMVSYCRPPAAHLRTGP
jgi:hypothetical protein